MLNRTVTLAFLVLSLIAPAFAEGELIASPLKAEVKIGTGLENRDPIGVAESFNQNDPLVAWTRVTGAKEPTEIKHIWSYEGIEQLVFTLAVKSSSFRTWSRKDPGSRPGKWTLLVKDAKGEVLASYGFEVKPPAQ